MKLPRQDDWQLFLSPLLLPIQSLPSISDLRNQPYRRADAVRRSVRRRFDDQNLRPVNNGEVVMWRGSSACAGRGWRQWGCVREGETGGLKDDKWKMTSVATIEMSMYIYYIWIHVIPCLWYSSSFSRWRTGTCVGLNFKCLKGWLRNLRQAKCLNLYCLSDDCF